MKMLKTFLSLGVMAMMFMDMAMAADYTVGSPNGAWDQATDLASWSSSITFLQGDNLLFKYSLNHDITEVSKADYDSCTVSNPLEAPHTGGSTVISLTSPGTRYFICGTGGHCIGGMKLQITTLPASSPPPAVPSPPPPSTTPAVPSPPPSAAPAAPLPSPSTTPVVPSPPPSTAPAAPSQPPSTAPAVPSPSPKHSPSHNTWAPSPTPKYSKEVSPSPSASEVSPSGSLSAPAPSSAAKFDGMSTLTGLVVMAFLINV